MLDARERLPDVDRQLAPAPSTATTSASRCSAPRAWRRRENPLAHTPRSCARRRARARRRCRTSSSSATCRATCASGRRSSPRSPRARRRRSATADARAPLVIGLAAWRSLREGRPVRIEEVETLMSDPFPPAPRRQGRRRHRQHPGARRCDRRPRAQLGAAGLVDLGTRPGARANGSVTSSAPSSSPATSRDEDDCRALIAACAKRFGRLDGLVNAAGLSTPRRARRHERRAVGPAVRRQRAGAVHPHAGGRTA